MAWYVRLASWFGFSALGDTKGQQMSQPFVANYRKAKPVTPDHALQLSAVWGCSRLLSEMVASIPLVLYRSQENGPPVAVDPFGTRPESELARVVCVRPNSRMTAYTFRMTQGLNECMDGNAYALIERRNNNDPNSPIVALWPMSSDQTRPVILDDGTLVYEHHTERGVKVLAQWRVLHFRLFGNGVVGLSPVAYAAGAIGAAIAMDERASNFYANGGKPTGVLMIDHALKPEQRDAIRKNFSGLAEGQDDSLLVLEAGAKYAQVSLSPQDAQLLESRRYQLEDICRFFGVPSVLINDTEKTTTWGTGVTQIVLGFYTMTLRPMLERWEAEMDATLLNARQRADGYFFQFDFDALLRADSVGRSAMLCQLVQNGIINRDEARSELNRPAIPDGSGKTYTAQVNLAPIADLGKGDGNGTQTTGAN